VTQTDETQARSLAEGADRVKARTAVRDLDFKAPCKAPGPHFLSLPCRVPIAVAQPLLYEAEQTNGPRQRKPLW
jgi:hypothetical protein